MQFLRNQSTQCVEATVTLDVPVALRFKKLLERENPRLPLLSLSNNRPAGVPKTLDLGPQRRTIPFQFTNTFAQVFHGSRLIGDDLYNLRFFCRLPRRT